MGPSEVADDGQDHHGGQVFGPEDRLDVLLHLSEVAVVPGVDDGDGEGLQLGRLHKINRFIWNHLFSTIMGHQKSGK